VSGRADREVESPAELERVLADRGHLRDLVFQGMDLGAVEVDWARVDVKRSVFVACEFPSAEVEATVRKRGAAVIPNLRDKRPYSVYPPRLYTYEELAPADAAIQRWFNRHGVPDPYEPIEAIAQRLHDTAMTDGIGDFLSARDPERVVGIMGGHSAGRDTADYERVVRLAHRLTAAGYLVVTGGGPGIMEAGNLGAYLTRAGDEREIDRALKRLRQAPVLGRGYAKAAEDVHARLAGGRRKGGKSLAIPTWNYEGEPIGRFATHIAKYFANSIREDGLLRIARAGVVFAPGGAGTVQEVFQDGTINAYSKAADQAPMLFVGCEHFAGSGIYALAASMAERAPTPYRHLLALTDDLDEALAHIESPPQRPRRGRSR